MGVFNLATVSVCFILFPLTAGEESTNPTGYLTSLLSPSRSCEPYVRVPTRLFDLSQINGIRHHPLLWYCFSVWFDSRLVSNQEKSGARSREFSLIGGVSCSLFKAYLSIPTTFPMLGRGGGSHATNRVGFKFPQTVSTERYPCTLAIRTFHNAACRYRNSGSLSRRRDSAWDTDALVLLALGPSFDSLTPVISRWSKFACPCPAIGLGGVLVSGRE
jgi:hypothetical protein